MDITTYAETAMTRQQGNTPIQATQIHTATVTTMTEK
jgi:hypothetical protein